MEIGIEKQCVQIQLLGQFRWLRSAFHKSRTSTYRNGAFHKGGNPVSLRNVVSGNREIEPVMLMSCTAKISLPSERAPIVSWFSFSSKLFLQTRWVKLHIYNAVAYVSVFASTRYFLLNGSHVEIHSGAANPFRLSIGRGSKCANCVRHHDAIYTGRENAFSSSSFDLVIPNLRQTPRTRD